MEEQNVLNTTGMKIVVDKEMKYEVGYINVLTRETLMNNKLPPLPKIDVMVKTVDQQWFTAQEVEKLREEAVQWERMKIINALEKRYEQACKDQITDCDSFYSGVAYGFDVAIQIIEGEIEE